MKKINLEAIHNLLIKYPEGLRPIRSGDTVAMVVSLATLLKLNQTKLINVVIDYYRDFQYLIPVIEKVFNQLNISIIYIRHHRAKIKFNKKETLLSFFPIASNPEKIRGCQGTFFDLRSNTLMRVKQPLEEIIAGGPNEHYTYGHRNPNHLYRF